MKKRKHSGGGGVPGRLGYLLVHEVLVSARELAVVALSWTRGRSHGWWPRSAGAQTAGKLSESHASGSVELPEEVRWWLDEVSATPITYPEHRI